MFTFLQNVSHLHAVVHSMAFCSDCSEFLYSNVVFLETGFYCGIDKIIYFAIRTRHFWKCSNAKINDTTRTAKKSSFHEDILRPPYFQVQNWPRDPTASIRNAIPIVYGWLYDESKQCQFRVWRPHFRGLLCPDVAKRRQSLGQLYALLL